MWKSELESSNNNGFFYGGLGIICDRFANNCCILISLILNELLEKT